MLYKINKTDLCKSKKVYIMTKKMLTKEKDLCYSKYVGRPKRQHFSSVAFFMPNRADIRIFEFVLRRGM